MEGKAGNTMVNVTVNVDKDVAVEVITQVLKDSEVMAAVAKAAPLAWEKALKRD